MGTLAFALLFAAAAGVFIALPVVRKPSRTGQRIEARGDERAHPALLERRDRALAALKELEFDHRTGKVSDVDYRELIAPIRLEAAEALKPLEGVAVGAQSFGRGKEESRTPTREARGRGGPTVTISGRRSGTAVRGAFLRLFLVVAAVLALALAASAALASERRPTLNELEHEVMCPTCQTPLELSDAPIAERMRVFIRERIRAGDTKSEIKAKLVSDFGEGVLAAPRTHGFGLLAWILPFAGLVGFGVAIGLVAWRWKRAGEVSRARAGPREDGRFGLDPALERLLDEELARFDV